MTLVIAIILAIQFNLSWEWYVVIIAVWIVKQLMALNHQFFSFEAGINAVLDDNDTIKKLIKSMKFKKD